MTLVRGKLGVKKAARQKRCQLPPQVDGSKRTNTMRKITAIAVALGFLTSVSLPAFATPAVNGVVKSDELSAEEEKRRERHRMDGRSPASARPTSPPQEEKEEGHDGEEVQPRRDRPLRPRRKRRRTRWRKVQPRRDRPLRCQEEKEERQREKKSEILYRIAA